MASDMSNAGAAADALQGIVIRIPAAADGHRRVAMLLAAMGQPPRQPVGPAWRQRVLAICRCYWDEWSRSHPSWRSAPGTYVPEELLIDRAPATASLKKTLAGLNAGLGGAGVLEPFFKHAMARVKGIELPGPTKPLVRKSEIDRVLDREAAYRKELGERADEVLPKRMPENSAASADANFATRNLRPFRPVWHILVAFSIVMDDWGRTAADAAARALHSYTQPRVSPRLDWWYLARCSEVADRTIAMAEALEQAVPHLELEHAAEHQLVRLRLC